MARTARNRDHRLAASDLRGRRRHGAAGSLHQRQPRHARGDGEAVGSAHLGGGEQLGFGRGSLHGIPPTTLVGERHHAPAYDARQWWTFTPSISRNRGLIIMQYALI
jgi:hypothetical protein